MNFLIQNRNNSNDARTLNLSRNKLMHSTIDKISFPKSLQSEQKLKGLEHTERYHDACDVWESIPPPFPSVTMYFNGSGNASVNATIAADARCGLVLKLRMSLALNTPKRRYPEDVGVGKMTTVSAE